MSVQYEMFPQETCEDTGSAISSPVSGSGATPCASPDGQTIANAGPPHVRVSRSARLASGKARRTSATFGPSLLDSSPDAALSFALANRLRAVVAGLGSNLYEHRWIGEYTDSGMWSPRHVATARPIVVSGCIGLPWPTPDASVAQDGETYETWEARRQAVKDRTGNGNGMGMPLTIAASLTAWPTTRPEDAESAGMRHSRETADTLTAVATLKAWPSPQARDHKSGETGESPLEHNARPLSEIAVLAGWPTPQARDHFPAHSPEYIADKKAQGHGMANLNDSVQLAAHGPERIGFLLGPNGWEICPASGQLSPAHSRFLMGLPPEWCEAAIAASSSLKARKRARSASAATVTP